MQSHLFERLYDRLKILHDKKGIVLTHTPKEDWTVGEYLPEWIYVNGHTHRNILINSAKVHVYADNQIGYKKKSLALKHFKLEDIADIFQDKNDGIYRISVREYLRFNIYKGINCHMNRVGFTLYMIKRDGYYMFFAKNEKTAKLYLLDGGVLRTVSIYNLQYYYEMMHLFAETIREGTKVYSIYLKQLSKDVQSFGGKGSIHGCIIDIDYFNHIYVNPYSGEVTPYFSLDFGQQTVYPSIENLLVEHCKELYEKFLKVKCNGVTMKSEPNEIAPTKAFIISTDQYKASTLYRKFQYLTEKGVIRVWDDTLFDDVVAKLSVLDKAENDDK